nr:SMC-Scp complex subunit ScpB [Mesorhizobium sp.]
MIEGGNAAMSFVDDDEPGGPEPFDNPAARLHLAETVRMAEAIVFASAEPVSEKALAARLPQGSDIAAAMAELQRIYDKRGVNLVRIGDAWAFRTAGDLAFLMNRDAVQQKKLSRAALEVLAIAAYHQPVTRAEIEEIRGVETSKGTLDLLMETGWIRMRGRRRTPGRPVTYGTTDAFLDHFGLAEIRDLPGMDELKGAGLLSTRMPSNFQVPTPMADPGLLADDEDELTDIDLEELGLLTPKGGDD